MTAFRGQVSCELGTALKRQKRCGYAASPGTQTGRDGRAEAETGEDLKHSLGRRHGAGGRQEIIVGNVNRVFHVCSLCPAAIRQP